MNFAFLRKIWENIKTFCSHCNICNAEDAETHFLARCWLSWLACYPNYMQSKCVVLRRIGGRSNFRSRDKDGGHTIRSANAENPLLYANFTALSSIEPELLPIEFLHCRNREFRAFLRK